MDQRRHAGDHDQHGRRHGVDADRPGGLEIAHIDEGRQTDGEGLKMAPCPLSEHRPGDSLNDISGQIMAMFVLTVAAAEAAVGLAILVTFFRNRGDIAVDDASVMKG